MGILTALASFAGGERANAASAKQARLNREFQERMSSTSHQRETIDLKKAGLNRILSVTGGGRGASTPSGATAQQRDVVTPAISTALQAKRLRQDLKNLKATQTLTDKQTQLTMNNTEKAFSEANTAYQQSLITTNERKMSDILRAIDQKIYTGKLGEFVRSIEKGGPAVATAKGLQMIESKFNKGK